MVPYSTTPDNRKQVTFFLACMAILTTQFFSDFFNKLELKVTIPSAFMVFGCYYWFFDHYLWKIPFIRKIHNIPDLNGKWPGTVELTDGEKNHTVKEVVGKIFQTWTNIQLEISSKETRSRIETISMDLSTPESPTLHYIYCVGAGEKITKENVSGTGCGELFSESNNSLKGTSFSSKLRKASLSLSR